MKKDDTVYLQHVLDAFNTIEEYFKALPKINLRPHACFMMEYGHPDAELPEQLQDPQMQNHDSRKTVMIFIYKQIRVAVR